MPNDGNIVNEYLSASKDYLDLISSMRFEDYIHNPLYIEAKTRAAIAMHKMVLRRKTYLT